MAWLMAERGWRVRVLDAASPGHGGSGNAAAILYPKLVDAALTPSHIQSLAFLRTLDILSDARLAEHVDRSGVLWLQTRKHRVEIGPDHPWWRRYVWPMTAEEASQKAGTSLTVPALWLPHAGLIHPAGLFARIFAHPLVEILPHHEVMRVTPDGMGWQLEVQRSVHGDQIHMTAEHLVIAVAGNIAPLLKTKHLPLKPVRGQISSFAPALPIKTTLCYGGYVTPEFQKQHVLGATFQPGRNDSSPCHEDQLANQAALLEAVPSLAQYMASSQVGSWRARASVRWQTPDYLPLVGWLPWPSDYEGYLRDRVPSRPLSASAIESLPKIGVSVGHGSKGFSQAWLAADLLCQALTQSAQPYLSEVQERLRPDRFLLKAWKRGQLK